MRKGYKVLLGMIIISGIILCVGITPQSRDNTRRFVENTETVFEKHQSEARCQKLNFDGFKELNAQGSALINFHDFDKNLTAPQKVYVIDLLAEDAYYYDGRSLKWYGLECMGPRLGERMNEKFPYQIRKFLIRLVNGYPFTHDVNKLQTESQLLQAREVNYYMPLKNQFNWLGDQSYMDNLLGIFEKIPTYGQVYIHCKNGRGRTTTFLALYDIFKNAKKVPLQDIINRHYCIGREDLFNTDTKEKGRWTGQALVARKAFVENFYEYMTSSQGYPHKNWSQWCQHKGIVWTNIKIHRGRL